MINKRGNTLNKDLDSGDNTTPNNLWYDRYNKGSFIVFVRKIVDNKSRSTSIIEASRLLTKANIKFEEIEHHAWNTWKISCNSFQDANSAIRNKLILELGLTLYIPKYKVFRNGVIKGIPSDIPLYELQATLEKDNPVLRLNYHIQTEEKRFCYKKMD